MTTSSGRLPLGPLRSFGSTEVQWRQTKEQLSLEHPGRRERPGHYQSISAMPEYCNKSFEELRWEDYQVCADVPCLAL